MDWESHKEKNTRLQLFNNISSTLTEKIKEKSTPTFG